MKLLNKTFRSIEEVVDFVKNNKDVREKWYKGNIIVTADHKFQIEVGRKSDDYEDRFKVGYDIETGETFCTLFVDHVKYVIENFNPARNLQSASFFNMYAISNAIVQMFDAVLCPGDMFAYDKPCDGMGSYDIYAIANVNGIIMAEFICNSTNHVEVMKMRFGSWGTPISARLLTEDEEFELDELREEKETHVWDLTKEELEQLRRDVCIGSCFISDYENSFNINPDEVCGYCDGYWEYLWFEHKEEAENVDSPEEFAIYCMSVTI